MLDHLDLLGGRHYGGGGVHRGLVPERGWGGKGTATGKLTPASPRTGTEEGGV